MYSNDEQTKNELTAMFGKFFRRRKKRLLTEDEVEFQKYIDTFTIFYLLFIVAGIFYCIFSKISVSFLGILLGITYCIMAVIYFFFFLRRKEFSLFKYFIVFGIISLIVGVYFFFLNSNNESSYLLWFGISLILTNLERILELFYLFRSNDPSKVVFLVSLILSISFGILVIINPFSHLLYREVLGIFSILFGMINLTQISLFQKRISEFVDSID